MGMSAYGMKHVSVSLAGVTALCMHRATWPPAGCTVCLDDAMCETMSDRDGSGLQLTNLQLLAYGCITVLNIQYVQGLHMMTTNCTAMTTRHHDQQQLEACLDLNATDDDDLLSCLCQIFVTICSE